MGLLNQERYAGRYLTGRRYSVMDMRSKAWTLHLKAHSGTCCPSVHLGFGSARQAVKQADCSFKPGWRQQGTSVQRRSAGRSGRKKQTQDFLESL